MKRHQWRLVGLVIFLFCTVVVSLPLAQEDLTRLVKRLKPSVVAILTYDKELKTLGQGSGFFISKKGDLITNYHVLEGASSAEIKTADGKLYPIKKVLAEDKEADLVRVLVEVSEDAAHPLSVSSSIPEVGEQVLVIGNPLGLEQTVSDGIVSAVREIPTFGKIIQVTAPISPGSSGSPVINMIRREYRENATKRFTRTLL
ncbi:S1C family serine protease [bacterium]|nr:S1C family serine protease [bacterium]